MNLKKITLLFILSYLSIVCIAQDLLVQKCELSSMDITARTNPRVDLNGDLCAVIKVSAPGEIIKVHGNVIGDIVKTGKDYWIYCTAGTKQIQFLFNDYNSINIDFSEYGINNLESASTIDMKLMDVVYENEDILIQVALKYYASKLFKAAIKILNPLVERGNTNAQILLASYYLEELKDKNKAFALLEKCSKNNIEAKLLYAALLINDDKTFDKGVAMMVEASEQGHLQATEHLTNLYKGNYQSGKYKDATKAYKYGYIMASKGYKDAQHFIACCLFSGTGIPKNEKEAVHWFTCAAQQGYKDSQRLLGAIFITGCTGQDKDIESAKRWLNMAASQGDEEAKKLLNELK